MSRAQAAPLAIVGGIAIAVLAAILIADPSKQLLAASVGVLGAVLGATISAAVALHVDAGRRADEARRLQADRERDERARAHAAEADARASRERARQAAIPLHTQFDDVARCLRSGYWPALREVQVVLTPDERGAIASQLRDFWFVVRWALQTLSELSAKAESERHRISEDAIGLELGLELERLNASHAATLLEQGSRVLEKATRDEMQVALDRQEREAIAARVIEALEKEMRPDRGR